jgi:predicted subunit of tRNA(5-methylaminomethyl-2-thiouridylate) methyltransferase
VDLALLYSGGKDSTLAALFLDSFYDVRLVTGRFGITDDWTHAEAAADRLGYAFEPIDLDRSVAEAAADILLDDGYPRNGIQHVHEHALERVADLAVDAVADGTRRDDRVPTVSRAQAQSLEDRHGIDYLSPLAGLGRHAVDRLVAENLRVETGPSATVPKADYEAELRALLAAEHGSETVESVFPDHEQSYVRGVRDGER